MSLAETRPHLHGIECMDCLAVSEEPGDTCPNCGNSDVLSVVIESCLGGGPVCASESHHFGRGDHVVHRPVDVDEVRQEPLT